MRAQGAALLDAEAVLFVDDGDGQRPEGNLLLDEGMRSEGHVRLAVRKSGAR
jgi:hypothetical protein